nr:rhodanese-like domain-containing protein [Gemella bergeri]
MMSLWISTLIVLFVIGLIALFNYLRLNRAVTKLPYVEFRQNLRKVQLVDVREKEDFKYAHINGARNMPLSQFNFLYTSLRKDQPIYLCDKNGTMAPRAALTLKKNGYTNVFMLKNGLQDWKENLKTKR